MTTTDDHPEIGPAVPGGRAAGLATALSAVLLTLFIVAWYWLPATREQGSAPHDRLFYLAVLPGLLVAAAWAPWRRLRRDPVLILALVFIGYLTLSVTWSPAPADPTPARAALDGLATAVFVIAVAVAVRGRWATGLRVAVVAGATSAALVSLVRLAQGFGYSGDRLKLPFHFEHPNLVAHYLGVAAVLAAGAALGSQRVAARWAWLAACGLLTVGVILTRSRTATAALLLCLVAAVALYVGRRAAALVALAMVASAVLMTSAVDGLVTGVVLRGDAGRDVIYRTLIERMGPRWPIGAGIGADDDVDFARGSEDFPRGFTVHHPHSAVVGTLYYGGVVGLALLGALIVAAARRGVALGRRRGDWDPLLLLGFGGLCLLIDGHRLVSNPHLSSWLLLWLPIGLVVAAGRPAAHIDTTGVRRHRRTAFDPEPVAPPAAATAAATAAVVGWTWLAGTGPAPLVLAAAAALVLLLAEELGTATALTAGLVFVATPWWWVTGPAAPVEPAALAVALVGARLWLEGVDRGPPALGIAGGIALAGAGSAAPLVGLGLAAPLWWWTRRRNGPVLWLLVVAAVWPVGWIATGALSDGIRPAAPGVGPALGAAAALVGRVLGAAGAVPAAVGALLGLAARRRWLGWWLIGSGLIAAATLDPADPGAGLLPLIPPAAAAVAVGVCWLGAELARIDRPPEDAAPLAGRRLAVARVLVAALLVAVVLSRLWPASAIGG